MSRPRFTRILIALASLLGAIPLMAQRPNPAPAPAAVFPYGEYVLFDAEHPQGTGRTAVFANSTVTLSETGKPAKVRGFAAHPQTVEMFDLQGPCTSPTTYRWQITADVLTLTEQAGPCSDPSHAGRAMTFRKAGTAPATATAVPAFPFGRYELVAVDSANGPPPGIIVEFTPTEAKVFSGGTQGETHAITFANGHLQFFELGDSCGEVGEYAWQVSGQWLDLIQVSDPCQQRAQSIMAVHFKKL